MPAHLLLLLLLLCCRCVQGFSCYGNCGVYIGRLVEEPVKLGTRMGGATDETFHRTDSDREGARYHDLTWGV